jgi:hypothetical protein
MPVRVIAFVIEPGGAAWQRDVGDVRQR